MEQENARSAAATATCGARHPTKKIVTVGGVIIPVSVHSATGLGKEVHRAANDNEFQWHNKRFGRINRDLHEQGDRKHTVKWSKVSGASGYYVYRKTSSGSYEKVTTIKSASTISYTDTDVKSKNGTTYTYKVVPYSGSYTGSFTAEKTVRMTAVSISSVKNSSSKKMTVKWSKNTKSSGYEIQYSTSSKFTSGNKKVTVTGASSSSKVISSLTKNKTYYVRIRTYKTLNGEKQYSAWSSTKSVKISK